MKWFIDTLKKYKSQAFLALLTLTLQQFSYAELQLNGVAIHSELGKEQFLAGLYSSSLTDDRKVLLITDEEKKIEVRIIAERFSTRRFKRMWIEGMAINASSVELANQSKNMATFSNLLKLKMSPGDIFAISRTDESVRVSLNDIELGIIEDPKFFDLLLRTWIGPVPLSSDFRDDLLVKGNIESDKLSRFETTIPTDDRVEVVTAGVKALKNRTRAPAIAAISTAPKVEAPKPIIAAPPKIAAPSISNTTSINTSTSSEPEEVPLIEAPKVDAPSITERQKEKPIANDEPAQAEASSTLTPEDSLFEEDDNEEFTAASLLEQQLYIAKLKRWSQKYLKYPRLALNRGYQGNVRLEIVVNRKGKVLSTEYLKESDHKSLNKEAKAAVKRATPFPPMPELLKGDSFTFTLPVAFKLVTKK